MRVIPLYKALHHSIIHMLDLDDIVLKLLFRAEKPLKVGRYSKKFRGSSFYYWK